MGPADASRKFLHQLLALSSRASIRLDRLLRFALEEAGGATASDAGRAMLVSSGAVPKPVLVAASFGAAMAVNPEISKSWPENGSCAAFVLQSGRSLCVDDHLKADVHVPLIAKSRSSLTVPILEGREVLGVLHLASMQPFHYSRVEVDHLAEVAAQTRRAIHRVLFRERVSRIRAPINMLGVSESFLELERRLKLVSACDAPVLIVGERGTGKEIAALAIHFWSKRRQRAFVPVLASGFAEGLLADELFGHERHAFTGARRMRQGKFQAASGGTLFLDEVGDLPADVQSALLRVLQWGEVQTLGRDLPQQVDVRVIAATNKDLAALVAAGRFRPDLYDRLRVLELEVPPLRTRREDIPLLAKHFLRMCCTEIRREMCCETTGGCPACRKMAHPDCATDEFYQVLQGYDWPGNVRELESLIMRLVTMIPDRILDVSHLPGEIASGFDRSVERNDSTKSDWTLAAVNKRHIEKVLSLAGNNQTKAARILGIPRTTLQAKMSRLGIDCQGRDEIATEL